MSVVNLILAFLFEWFGFLFSFQGAFVWFIGLLAFLLMPFLSKATEAYKRLANVHLYLAAGLVGRAAVLVSEHNDILFKQMQFSDLGVETIKVGDEIKEFEDPDASLHYWMGIPFALADEVHGLLFDPRHAALGARKKHDKDRNEDMVYATDDEWQQYGFGKWYKGVWEFPKDVYELVNLRYVRQLVDGGERAEYPKRVEKMYENSRVPFQNGTSTTRFLLLLVALIGPFGAMWFFASQGGGGSTGEVGWNSVAWLLVSGVGIKAWFSGIKDRVAGGSKPDKPDIDWKVLAGAFVLASPIFILLAVFYFFGPIIALFTGLTGLLGFAFMPMLTVLVRPSAMLSGGVANLLLKLGLEGYKEPVFNWTPRKYELIEATQIEHDNEPTWYGMAGSLIGFTFEPQPESWDAEVVDTDRLEANQELAADGGEAGNIPPGYVRAPSITRADGYYGAFLPKRFDDGSYYIDSAIARARFTDSANGEKSLSRLLWAKEEFGEDDGMDDRTLVYAMLGSSILSFIAGLVVFFLV